MKIYFTPRYKTECNRVLSYSEKENKDFKQITFILSCFYLATEELPTCQTFAGAPEKSHSRFFGRQS